MFVRDRMCLVRGCRVAAGDGLVYTVHRTKPSRTHGQIGAMLMLELARFHANEQRKGAHGVIQRAVQPQCDLPAKHSQAAASQLSEYLINIIYG